jgi:uncharacterized protein (TIGR02246 family)
MNKPISLFVGLSLAVCVVAVVNAQEGTSPEEAFEAMAAKWGEAWMKGDMEGLAALYSEDADLISNDGKLYKGRDGIVQYFEELAGTAFKGTQIIIERTHIRQITPDIMVGDSEWEFTGVPEVEGQSLPTKGTSTVVVVNQDGNWVITSHRSRVPPPMPTAPE